MTTTTQPPLTYPQRTRRPTWGLTYRLGTYVTYYRQGNATYAVDHRTADKAQACASRDRLIAHLASLGGVPAIRGRQKHGPQPGTRQFIHYRPAYSVKDGRRTVGVYDTEAEAMAARDAHYGLTAAGPATATGAAGPATATGAAKRKGDA